MLIRNYFIRNFFKGRKIVQNLRVMSIRKRIRKMVLSDGLVSIEFQNVCLCGMGIDFDLYFVSLLSYRKCKCYMEIYFEL